MSRMYAKLYVLHNTNNTSLRFQNLLQDALTQGMDYIIRIGNTCPVSWHLYYLCGKTIFQCKGTIRAGNYVNGIFKITDLNQGIIIIQVSSAVVAATLRERPAPTTAYTAALELFCVMYAIQLCLLRFGAAFPNQPWSLGTCRSIAGRYQASWEAGSGSKV